MGYRIVTAYMERHAGTKPATLVGLAGKTVLEASGYHPIKAAA